MRLLPYVLILGAALLFAPAVLAAGLATPDEAKAMAIKAADYLKANGPEKVFSEFNAKDGTWHDRDLYVLVRDSKGVMVANGENHGLFGKNVLDLKDPDGKAFQREKLTITDAGWINYRWLNPISRQVEPKSQYVIRVGDYLVGVGAYAR